MARRQRNLARSFWTIEQQRENRFYCTCVRAAFCINQKEKLLRFFALTERSARIYDFDAWNWTKWDVWLARTTIAFSETSPPAAKNVSDAQGCLELKQDAMHAQSRQLSCWFFNKDYKGKTCSRAFDVCFMILLRRRVCAHTLCCSLVDFIVCLFVGAVCAHHLGKGRS